MVVKFMTDLTDTRHEHFLRLYTANEPALRAFVRRLVPARDDAHDVLQEVALVLWRKFDETLPDEDFRRWAFGVARLQTLAWRRDCARDRLVLAEDVLEMIAEESEQADRHLAAQREALRGCLQKLPQGQRSLVMAAYAGGTRIQELAAQAGRTVTAFYQWLHRTRLGLLICLRRTLEKEARV